MGLAAGGMMRQRIYPDPHGIGTWKERPGAAVTIHIVSSDQFRDVTGLAPPPSPIDTQTYIFPTQVLTQNAPPQVSLSWGELGPDWEMDPEVVNHADPANKAVADDLKTIPTVSIVMDWNDLFGTGLAPGSTGAIYPPR